VTSSNVLQYSDLPARWGIAIESDAQGFRLVVPPVPAWHLLPRAYLNGFLVLVGLVASNVVPPLLHRPPQWDNVLPPLIVDALFVTCFVSMAYYRLYRWAAFEITAERFRFIPWGVLGGASLGDWPRVDVVEARANAFNGKLILRIRGQDPIEIFVSANRRVAQFVAEKLAEALARSYEPAPLSAQPATPTVFAVNRLPACWQRTATSAAIYAMLALLPVVWCMWPTVGLLLLGTVILAAIPLGICLGTQRKDFYF
jgi:hypothetical protein